MLCVASIGRIVLIIVNFISAVVGVGLIACGCVIKYVLGGILRSDVVDLVSKSAFALFVKNTPVSSNINFGLFTDKIGIVLIVLGAFLLVLSLIGCCAVRCSSRILLLLFCVLTGVLIIAQIATYPVFLTKNSAVYDDAKKTLKEKLRDDYNRVNINTFTISADIIFQAAQCCGVEGPKDFRTNHNLRFNFCGQVIDPAIPPSCCEREYINALDWDCAKNYSMGYSQGCYEKLQDVVEGWYPWLIPAILISFAVQIGEIFGAVIILRNDENFVV